MSAFHALRRAGLVFAIGSAALIAMGTPGGFAASSESGAQWGAQTSYRAVYGWEKLPEGRKLGVVSGVFPDPDGEHIWVLSRCGGNGCAGSDVDPILKFDLEGNLIDSFGGGLTAWPHGFFLDHEGNLWVTEGAPAGDQRGEAGIALGMGHQVLKFSPEGEVLMRLGEAGVPGDDENHFNGPAGVAVARNGDIWVVDGHRGGNNRMLRFAPDGTFLQEWGGGIDSASAEPGLFNDPHHIAFDSAGRIFVSDRGNNRLQIFYSQGNFIELWTQFSRPSGIYIDANDMIYVADGMSGAEYNPGGQRGIRVGNARTGEVITRIDDHHEYGPGQSGAEFLAIDADGNIYAGEVASQRLVKFVPVE